MQGIRLQESAGLSPERRYIYGQHMVTPSCINHVSKGNDGDSVQPPRDKFPEPVCSNVVGTDATGGHSSTTRNPRAQTAQPAPPAHIDQTQAVGKPALATDGSVPAMTVLCPSTLATNHANGLRLLAFKACTTHSPGHLRLLVAGSSYTILSGGKSPSPDDWPEPKQDKIVGNPHGKKVHLCLPP